MCGTGSGNCGIGCGNCGIGSGNCGTGCGNLQLKQLQNALQILTGTEDAHTKHTGIDEEKSTVTNWGSNNSNRCKSWG